MKIPVKVILEDIRSAFNVGSIFRTSDAAGIEEIILTEITPYPPHNRIPKTALGAIDTVKWQYIKDVDDAIEYSRKSSKVISIEITEMAEDFYDFEFLQPTTLIFGNEISGVKQSTLDKSDHILKIPMFGTKHSLNIANSYSIAVYEIVRQWLKSSKSGL